MSENPKRLSPSVLAFVGDAVYGLYVRRALADVNRPSGELHRLSVKLVNAGAQTRAFAVIAPMLTESEQEIFKRGRNFHTSTTPKHASNADYHTATGLETLFGYLHLSGQEERADELFSAIWRSASAGQGAPAGNPDRGTPGGDPDEASAES